MYKKRGEKWSYQDLFKAFKRKGCTLITGEQEFIDNKLSTMTKVIFIAKCGHERCMSWNNFKGKTTHPNCADCNNKISRINQSNSNRIDYDEFKERFSDKGCELKMTREQYYSKRITTQKKVTFSHKKGLSTGLMIWISAYAVHIFSNVYIYMIIEKEGS